MVYLDRGAVRNALLLLERPFPTETSSPSDRLPHQRLEELGREVTDHPDEAASPYAALCGGGWRDDWRSRCFLQHPAAKLRRTGPMMTGGNAALSMVMPDSVRVHRVQPYRPARPMPGLMGGYLADRHATATKLSWIPSGFWGPSLRALPPRLVVRLTELTAAASPGSGPHHRPGCWLPLLGLLFVRLADDLRSSTRRFGAVQPLDRWRLPKLRAATAWCL